jgi:Phage tail sheath C-terminal domain/Phage tail sheath protein subtilisin-like domain
MAGGTWSKQNKVRPGAYINFTAAPRSTTSIGVRGIVAFPVALPWGEANKLIKVTSEDLVTGRSYALTGISVQDDTEAAQMLREALKNSYTALVYRINTGGVKATATLATDVTATARHAGTIGNSITITVETVTGGFNITTVVDGVVRDVQTVADVASFVTNDWVMISGAGTLTDTAGTPLVGGTSGTAGTYDNFYDALGSSTVLWNTVAIPATTEATAATTFIRNMRETEGRYVQAVVNNATDPNYEGVINTRAQGYIYENGERVEPTVFTVWLAGAQAGAQIDQSNTYKVVQGAVDIINPLKNSEIEEALTAGYIVLCTRQDGKVVIEQDINSLVEYTQDRPRDWSKNRIVRTLDDIATSIRKSFESNYIGKVDNNKSGRTILKADIVSLFNQLAEIGAIRDFDSSKDITIEQGETIDSVIASISVYPVDSMERLFAVITLK